MSQVGFGQISPLPLWKFAKCNVHNSGSDQRNHSISQGSTHPPYLAVPSFGQHNLEPKWPHWHYSTGSCRSIQNHHPLRHVFQKCRREISINPDDIFPLMPKLRPKESVHNLPVIGQQNETRGIFIEPPDGKNSFLMTDKGNNISSNPRLTGGGDPDRFMKFDVDGGIPPGNLKPIQGNTIPRDHLIAKVSGLPINGDPARLNCAISFPTRTDALIGKKFVNSAGWQWKATKNVLIW